MAEVPHALAQRLATSFEISPAVETGMHLGKSTRVLARIFPRVETIELSRWYALRVRLLSLPRRNITVRRGESQNVLRSTDEPTLYWLDTHWSGGATAGKSFECPVLDEIRATSPGHPHDCYLIDDARLFETPPPPPHNPMHWPVLADIERLISELRPNHSVSIMGDVVIIVPREDQPSFEDH